MRVLQWLAITGPANLSLIVVRGTSRAAPRRSAFSVQRSLQVAKANHAAQPKNMEGDGEGYDPTCSPAPVEARPVTRGAYPYKSHKRLN